MLKKLKMLLLIGIVGILSILLLDQYVTKKNAKKLFSSTKTIPSNKVGLLLGTIKTLSNGRENMYYRFRVNAAASLYKAGKIKYILASGDNRMVGYDEPTQMKEDLIKLGVPANRIYLDYAGFRTLDSVVRAKKVFGQNKLTVISQDWHNERALLIADHQDINAIGFNAKDVRKKYGWKVLLREKLARVKVVLDLAIGKKPKFLGKPIHIG